MSIHFNTTTQAADAQVKDVTAEKIREYFLQFLEKFTEVPDHHPHLHHPPQLDPSSNLHSDLYSTQASMLHSSLASDLPSGTGGSGVPYYRRQIIGMKHDGLNTLFVDYNHLFQYNDVLATAIAENYYRFEPYLRKAVSAFVQNYIPDYTVIANSRQKRQFWIAFYGLSVIHKLRDLDTSKISQLVTISGTATRTSEVRPELYLGTFQCNECRSVVRDVEQQFRYTEPTICQNPICGNRSNWTLLMEQSIFLDWQRIRVQENSSEIPPGSMPRTLDVIVRNDLVENAKAGDKCDFTGCVIVIPDISQLALPGGKLEGRTDARSKDGFAPGGVTGLKALGVRELSYKIAFNACMVTSSDARTGTPLLATIHDTKDENMQPIEELFNLEEREEILKIKNTPNVYQKLADSIAPSIFGHQDVKAGILLMLFGGIHKVTSEGINLRGDINICIVGDPGTAKSQFLKYVTGFLPRSVYTSGKSASAAGLTASVVKDEETGEFAIEAGALMLSDNGICAIDEFDKMDLTDQVAIHEAMEQQTISIAKAGIHATLNARTSILAAANPIHGRYDKRKSLRQNIAMTAPIMSRFDLFFVIIDDCNETSDYNIARHILSIHRFKDEAMDPEFSADQLQRYIKYAKTLKPIIGPESASLLAEKYCQLRQSDLMGPSSSYRMTVRQLESMIRLSEALARLHLDGEVRPRYVREAHRLLKSSLIRVESESIELLSDDPSDSLMSKGDEVHAQPSTLDSNATATTLDSTDSTTTTTSGSTSDRQISMKYEEYVRISNLLVYRLRHHDSDADIGLAKASLIQWYLEQIEEEIETEAEFVMKKKQVRAVIERLVHKDCVLIELKEEEQADPILVVHPNYHP